MAVWVSQDRFVSRNSSGGMEKREEDEKREKKKKRRQTNPVEAAQTRLSQLETSHLALDTTPRRLEPARNRRRDARRWLPFIAKSLLVPAK